MRTALVKTQVLSAEDRADGVADCASDVIQSAGDVLAEISMRDFWLLEAASRDGVGAVYEYVRTHPGKRLRLAWPVGWYLSISRVPIEPFSRPAGAEAVCFVGRVAYSAMPKRYIRNGGPAVFFANGGRVLCAVGGKQPVVRCVARTVMEFARSGMGRFDPASFASSEVTRFIRQPRFGDLLVAWDMGGLVRVARFVIRNHGLMLDLRRPHGSVLRLCALSCLLSRSCGGVLLRGVQSHFRCSHTGLGVAFVNAEDRLAYRGLKRGMPLIVLDSGVVVACDLKRCCYSVVGHDLRDLYEFGLERLFEKRRAEAGDVRGASR